MDDVQKGFYWHVHHGRLIEFCYGYEERASFIRTDKPTDEQETRLRLFKPVKGSLPQEVIEARQVCDKARQVCDKARQAYTKARQVCDKARQAYTKARQVYTKAWKAREKAWQAYDKAWQACVEALNNNMLAITALHEKECPNCPWNGKTIFPKT